MSWRAFRVYLSLLGASLAAQAAPVPVGGLILDTRERPVAGATVEIFRLPRPFVDARTLLGVEEPKPVATVVSDEDGRFAGSFPEPGMARLRVQARGFLSQQLDGLPVVEEAELPVVRLQPSKALHVRVTDPKGLPVAGARVRAVSPPEDVTRPGAGYVFWRPAPRFAVTGRDGKALLPAGDYEVLFTAVADGFLETSSKDLNSGTVTLRLSRGCRRTVEIWSLRHQPAAGVLIQSGRWSLGLTGADGRAEVTTPCQGETALYLLTPDGRWSRAGTRPANGSEAALRFTLPPRGAQLAGRVLDVTSRQPIAGALVWPTDDPAACTLSDVQGHYRVRAPVRPDAQLLATVDGASFASDSWTPPGRSQTGPAAVRAEEGPRPGPTLYLRPAESVTVQVADEKARPVAGAQARVTLVNRIALTRSDAQGKLRLKLASPQEPFEVWISHPDFLQAHLFLGRAALRRGPPFKIVLRRGAHPYATLVDPEGRPVAGAKGFLIPWAETQAGDRPLQADSNGQGILRFQQVPPGKYDLRVQAPGRASLEIPGVAVRGPGDAEDLGTFHLEPGALLEGRVVDSQNRPVAGASVVHRDALEGSREPVVTGADGRFSLPGLRGGSWVQLTAWKTGYAGRSLGAVEVPVREPLTIVLTPSHRIAGSVRDEEGAPVRDALLILHGKNVLGGSMMASFPQEVHDPDGRFELLVDEPGTLSLLVSATGYLVKEIPLEVPAEGGVDSLEIVVQAASCVVTGRLTGPEGEPIAQTSIYFGRKDPGGPQPSTYPVTDSAGQFRSAGLSEGLWSVFVQSPGYLPVRRDLEVQAGENRLDLQLERGLEVEGEVVDADGRPLPRVQLGLTAKEGSLSGGFATSDESGHFLIQGVEPGDFALSAWSAGFLNESMDVPLAGSSVRGLRIVLERGGVIRGRLLGLNPQELAEAQVVAAQSGGSTDQTRADFRGEYELRGLEPGEWTVSARTASGRGAQATVTLPAGTGEAVRDVEFLPGWTLSGRVVLGGESKSTLPATVRVWSDTEYRITAVNPYGEFRFEALPPGTFKMEALSPNDKILSAQDVEIQGDRSVEIELPP